MTMTRPTEIQPPSMLDVNLNRHGVDEQALEAPGLAETKPQQIPEIPGDPNSAGGTPTSNGKKKSKSKRKKCVGPVLENVRWHAGLRECDRKSRPASRSITLTGP